MTADALNNDPLAVLRKNREQSRIDFGSKTVTNRFNSGASARDVITKAGYFLSSQKTSQQGSLPPLQGTVLPLNHQQGTEFDNIMTGSRNTRSKKDATLTVNAADYHKMEQENKQLRKEAGTLPAEKKELTEENSKLVEENKNLRVEVAHLREQINKMKKKRGRKGVACRKSEQNEDVKEAINEYVKGVLFRTVKFAQSGDQLTKASKLVWKGIKDKKKLEIGENALTEDDFCEIYDSFVATCLSLRRQYVQTQTQKAAEELLDKLGTLPSTHEIENVWDLPEVTEASSDEDKAKYEAKVDLLTWYLDVFMPKAVGLEFWGDIIRPYKLMTDTELVEGDLSGKKKVLVTVTSEAFGLLVYHNCRDKWIADYKYKKQHGKKVPVPKFKKDDPSTHAHVNKWSNSCSGSVVGGGWHVDALKKFNALKDHVKAFREAEKDNGYKKMEYGKNLIVAANNINLNGGKLAGQKRKAPSKDAENNVEVVDITFEDE